MLALGGDPSPARVPIGSAALEPVLGRLRPPCGDPRVSGGLVQAGADQPVSGRVAARLVDTFGVGSSSQAVSVA